MKKQKIPFDENKIIGQTIIDMEINFHCNFNLDFYKFKNAIKIDCIIKTEDIPKFKNELNLLCNKYSLKCK